MKTQRNLPYSKEYDPRKTLDLYLPESDLRAFFLYFHGGGLTVGGKGDSVPFAEALTEAGVIFASADYRMYPEAIYPAFICDAAEATAYVAALRKRYGDLPLYVGGSSAGGYLSMMLCFDRRYYDAVGLDPSAVNGYFHDAGQPTAHFEVLRRRGEDPRRVIVDESAPLYYVGREERDPPMRFLVSDGDLPGRYEQTMLMLATLKHFGYQNYDVRVMHGGHCHYVGAVDEQGRRVFPRMILDFLHSQGI